MRILIIDDSEYKYKQIKSSLDRLISPWIVWSKSRNSGLISILKHNVRKEYEPFDLVITDNIMPIYDGEAELEPYACDIVDEIRRLGLDDLPVIVCSTDDVKECDYNYKIKYDDSIFLDNVLKLILDDLNGYKTLEKQNKCKKENIYTNVVGSAKIIHKTDVNFSCSNHDSLGLCNVLECLYCDNSAYMIMLESSEGIIKSDNDTFSDKFSKDGKLTDYDHEILFYDKIPKIDELFSYLFDENSQYRIIRKIDNEIMVDKVKQVDEEAKTFVKRKNIK